MSTLDWALDRRAGASAVRSKIRALAASPMMLVVLVLVGVVVRIAFLTLHRAWGGLAEYDDGVHLGGAELLFAGRIPYSGFTFLQPPGILLLLQPVAALAHLIGEDRALAVGRLVFVTIGALNICLVWKLLRRKGAVAAAVAAGFYAVWFGTASTERTIMLEPLLNLGLLLTLLLARRSSRRAILMAGIVLGLTCTVKLWSLVFVPVIAVWVAREHSVRQACLFLVGAAGALSVVIAPFWILAGGAFPHQIVFSQLGRPRFISLIERLRYLDGLPPHSSLQWLIPGAGLVVLAALIVFAAVRMARCDREIALWCALLLVGGATLAYGSSFYYHYPAFVGVPLAAILGTAAMTLWSSLRGAGRIALLGVAAVAGLVLALGAVRGGMSVDRARHQVPVAARARCVWANAPALLITINHFDSQVSCNFTLDPYSGLALSVGQVTANREFQREFIRAGAALLEWGGPRAQGWTANTVHVFEEHFRFAGELPAGVSLWIRRSGPT